MLSAGVGCRGRPLDCCRRRGTAGVLSRRDVVRTCVGARFPGRGRRSGPRGEHEIGVDPPMLDDAFSTHRLRTSDITQRLRDRWRADSDEHEEGERQLASGWLRRIREAIRVLHGLTTCVNPVTFTS